MPEQSTELEQYKYNLSELESHLSNVQNQLNQNELDKQNILNDIDQTQIQIDYTKEQIRQIEENQESE